MSVCVDKAVRLCCTQQARLTQTISECRALLLSGKIPVSYSHEPEGSDRFPVQDEGVAVEEQEEVELLEKALKKAVKVRSSSAVSRSHQREPLGPPTTRTGTLGPPPTRTGPLGPPTTRTGTLGPPPTRTGPLGPPTTRTGTLGPPPTRTGPLGPPTTGTGLLGPPTTRTGPLGPPTTGTGPLGPPPTKRGLAPTTEGFPRGKPPVPNPASVQKSRTNDQKKSSQSSAHSKHSKPPNPPSEDQQLQPRLNKSLLNPVLVVSPWFSKWQAHRTKNNSLWNKVLTRHSGPVPKRVSFRERLSGTFPDDWNYGHLSVRRAELDYLTQLGLDLAHCHRATIQNHPEPGVSVEIRYELVLMLQGLERMMISVIKDGERLKKECKTNAGRPVFPVRRRSVLGDPTCSGLPFLLSYRSQSELEELNSLKLRVDQLQLEVHLHQVLFDTIMHHVTPQHSMPRHPAATSLRGLYSLLGEGGAQFPTIILDSEPHPL